MVASIDSYMYMCMYTQCTCSGYEWRRPSLVLLHLVRQVFAGNEVTDELVLMSQNHKHSGSPGEAGVCW